MTKEETEFSWHDDNIAKASATFTQRLELMQQTAADLALAMSHAHDAFRQGKTGQFSVSHDDRYDALSAHITLFDENILGTKEFLAGEGANMDSVYKTMRNLGVSLESMPPNVTVHSITLYDELLTESFEAFVSEAKSLLAIYDIELSPLLERGIERLTNYDAAMAYQPENKTATFMTKRLEGYQLADKSLDAWLEKISPILEETISKSKLNDFGRVMAQCDENFHRELMVTDALIHNAQLPDDERQLAADIISENGGKIALKWQNTECLETSDAFLQERDVVLARQFDNMVKEVEATVCEAGVEMPLDLKMQLGSYRMSAKELFQSFEPATVLSEQSGGIEGSNDRGKPTKGKS